MKKILIANRGEIALRIMRSAKEMGIKTLAVFSEADRNALHVRFADEAVCIGPPPSAESYLDGSKIIESALALKADAIHPGYGFLSENADFSEAVEKSGITFIGPSSSAIRIMGSKLAAKKAVSVYQIPLVPGTESAIDDLEEAKEVARNIGFPLLVKASAGGGGKGMRKVEKEADLSEQIQRAMSEAQSAFGDQAVFIEKYVQSPRHIEFQILGDQHGNYVHLWERECSIQRRHQKVVEEAPSSILSPELREKMGEAAINVARSCQYYGAGTVEFLVDKNLDFYFLEMNTRIQVEHPVTEQITGIDLIKEQIRIAQGKKLSFQQKDIQCEGHSIEVRVYAEDPTNHFLPDTGLLKTYQRPQGAGIRVDDGYEQGMEIPIYYDPMIAKLITFGKNRKESIQKMIRAIEEYKISGIATTLDFCKFVMQHPSFESGKFDTHFVDKHFKKEYLSQKQNEKEEQIAAVLSAFLIEAKTSTDKIVRNKESSKWKNRRRQ